MLGWWFVRVQEQDFLFTVMNELHSCYIHHVLYIEAVTLASCSTAPPPPTVVPARLNVIQSLGVATRSVSTHMYTHIQPKPLLLLYTVGKVVLWHSDRWIESKVEKDSGIPSRLIGTADRWNYTGTVAEARLTNEHRDVGWKKGGRATSRNAAH